MIPNFHSSLGLAERAWTTKSYPLGTEALSVMDPFLQKLHKWRGVFQNAFIPLNYCQAGTKGVVHLRLVACGVVTSKGTKQITCVFQCIQHVRIEYGLGFHWILGLLITCRVYRHLRRAHGANREGSPAGELAAHFRAATVAVDARVNVAATVGARAEGVAVWSEHGE
jgi:hypothetical protein